MTQMTDTERERKAFDIPEDSSEIRSALDAFMRAFEEFKDANDERLSQIDRQISTDAVTRDKVSRINDALGKQQKALNGLLLGANRPRLESAALTPMHQDDHAEAFDAYIRKGDASEIAHFAQSVQHEGKALSASTESAGGYLVPDEIDARIHQLLRAVSPIRAIATVQRSGGGAFKATLARTSAAASWADETSARATDTSTPTIEEVEIPSGELYALPAATQTILDDANIDIAEWLAQELQTVFAVKEGEAFVSGDGVDKPKGFLSYEKQAPSGADWNKISYVLSGRNGDFPASDPSDKLLELIYALKAPYRAGARWVMGQSALSKIRAFKDSDGNYIWRPGLSGGQPSSLMGFPVAEAEDMPDLATGSFSIAFGDFRQAYLILDRAGMRVLRDPYSKKPYVLFYTTKRVGGGVRNFEALKLMKFSAA